MTADSDGDDSCGVRELITAGALDALIERIVLAYFRAVGSTADGTHAEGQLTAQRRDRVTIMVVEIVGRFRRLPPGSNVATTLPPPRWVGRSTPDAADAATALFRILTREVASALDEDPIDIASAVVSRLMSDVSGVFDNMAIAAACNRQYREEVDPAALREHVTPGEAAVFQLVVDGTPRKQIADELHLSPRTVRNHVTSIGKKLGGQGRTALIERARELQILVLIPVVAVSATLNDVITAASTMS